MFPIFCFHNWRNISATTLVSVRNTEMILNTLQPLMAQTEPWIVWRRRTHYLSPRQQVVLHTWSVYFQSGFWWCIRIIRMTRLLHSSHGLQLSCSSLQNALQCLCLSPAECHILPLHFCYTVCAALFPCISLVSRCCYLLQYCLRVGYIAFCSICFTIIVLDRSKIYSAIFILSSTVPSILQIQR